MQSDHRTCTSRDLTTYVAREQPARMSCTAIKLDRPAIGRDLHPKAVFEGQVLKDNVKP